MNNINIITRKLKKSLNEDYMLPESQAFISKYDIEAKETIFQQEISEYAISYIMEAFKEADIVAYEKFLDDFFADGNNFDYETLEGLFATYPTKE